MATILFVDDDEMERYFAREVLETRGHRVLYAPDGETALRVFEQENVELVVTDLAMPRLNGLRLIQQLRARDRQVRIIAASGINADQLDMAEDLGAIAVLQKPWDPRTFLEMLDRSLAQKEGEQAALENVWPTVFNDLKVDEQGRLVREGDEADGESAPEGEAQGIAGATQGAPVTASGEPDAQAEAPDAEADEGEEDEEDEAYDLGLEGMELEVEDPDDDRRR
jgi:CheY-like chemotaxis protein